MLRSVREHGARGGSGVVQWSVRSVKSFTYRGGAQTFSNRWHFMGAPPSSPAQWDDVFDALSTYEHNVYTSAVTIIGWHGYLAGSDVAVRSRVTSTPGILASTGAAAPGDCAAVWRSATTKISVKNHVVYVFSYFHGVRTTGSASDGDTILFTQKQQLEAMANVLHTGLAAGTLELVRCTPDGHPITGAVIEPYIGHRDFL